MKIFKFDKYKLNYEEHPNKLLLYFIYGIIVMAVGAIFAIAMFFFTQIYFPPKKLGIKKYR